MIDHLLGRPSTKLKRAQVFSVILFWLYFLLTGNRNGPKRIPLIRWLNKHASESILPVPSLSLPPLADICPSPSL